MKNALIIGLSILSLALAGQHYNREMNEIPKELEKRTKIAWYIGCVGSIGNSGVVIPTLVFQYCDEGYGVQDFDAMNQAIESEQEIFFSTH